MSNVVINIEGVKCCAFCKYWWDPSCRYIQPYLREQWSYDNAAKSRCIKRSVDTLAYASCGNYKCKIEL